MIIVGSCMIWFHFNCIMQLKKSYQIATNVCIRESATTFGDLPECLSTEKYLTIINRKVLFTVHFKACVHIFCISLCFIVTYWL